MPVGAMSSAATHLPSYTMDTVSFLGVKRTGRGVDQSSHLAPRLKKEKSYISITPLDLRGML